MVKAASGPQAGNRSMKRKSGFDEVMIVNPEEPGSDTTRRVRLMRFHNVFPSEMGEFAEPEYGYYGEVDPAMGYYSEVDPAMGYYGEVDPLGYYAEAEPGYGYYSGYYGEIDPAMAYGEMDPAMGYYGGYYGEVDPLGYYGEVDPAFGYYAEAPEYGPVGDWGESDVYGSPVGYFAEEFPVGYYGEETHPGVGYYGEMPEMVGYGEPDFAEGYPAVAYYGEPEFGEADFAGYGAYVRATPEAFNAGCPLPSNVSGLDDGFGAYMKPATVNPSCEQMSAQPGSPPSPPETFKPLW